MNVARLEGRIALERFLKKFPSYHLEGAPVRSPCALLRLYRAADDRGLNLAASITTQGLMQSLRLAISLQR
jgi:hypothetical protein